MFLGIYILSAVALSAAILLFRNKYANYFCAASFLGMQWGLTVDALTRPNSVELGYFTMDALGTLFLALLSVVGTISLYYSYLYVEGRNETPKRRSYYLAAFVMLNASLACAYLANHVAISWICVELTTLSSSILIYHRRTEKALEATWKYIFICSVSVALIFMGILILGLAMQQARGGELFYSNLVAVAPKLDQFWLMSAFLLIFTGFTVKAGLVPMYTAGIDAKDKAPSPIGAMLSSAVLNVGMLGIIRIYEIVAHTNARGWASMIMIISAVLSIFISAQYMLRAKNFKRMFAYSSVEHMGVALVGVALGGIGAYAALLHIALHSLVKSSLYFQFGTIYRIYKSDLIKDAGGYFHTNVFGALTVLLAFFMITAIPPSGLFVSEFGIFRAMWESGMAWMIVIVGILLAFIVWSFGENIFRLLFGNPMETHGRVRSAPAFIEAAPQYALLIAAIYFGFFPPEFFSNLLSSAATLIQ